MSDVVERLRMYHESRWAAEAADEIERLRSEIANDVIFKALRERIEELEEKQRTIDVIDHIGLSKAHIITTEQIDAAWERAGELAIESHRYVQPDCLETLAELGIVRCEMCDGQGAWGISEEGDTHLCDCCDGKRWVKR